jgi:hypothetical protein
MQMTIHFLQQKAEEYELTASDKYFGVIRPVQCSSYFFFLFIRNFVYANTGRVFCKFPTTSNPMHFVVINFS